MNPVSGSLTNQLKGTVLLVCALLLVNAGEVIAGPGNATGTDMGGEAIRGMQWPGKLTSPNPQAVTRPVPVQQPGVEKPDLSGLPKQLPQNVAVPQIGNGSPPPASTRPSVDSIPVEKPALIKPRILDDGKAERTQRKPQRVKERSRTSERASVRPSTRVKTTQQTVKKQMPAPIPKRASATSAEPTASLKRAEIPTDPRTGLIKPRLGGFTSEKKRSAEKASARKH